MNEWIITILLACVTIDGKRDYQQVGFATNKDELIIVLPPSLNVRLRRKDKVNDIYILADSVNNPYSIQFIYERQEFIFFIQQLEENKDKGLNKLPFKPVKSYIVATADSKANQIFRNK